MKILCTFPGRYGDLLWTLPSIRALSRRVGQPINLLIAGEFASITLLLQQQPYLGQIITDPAWSLSPPNEWQAPPISGFDLTFHLGYRGWPTLALPYEALHNLNAETVDAGMRSAGMGNIQPSELALTDPWIQVDGPGPPCELAVGFTEAWFELKLGLLASLDRYLPPYVQLTPPGSRWTTEGVGLVAVQAGDWLIHARTIRNSERFLGDCSALHVLAVAMGIPAIICEPMEARWNPIFYPVGMDGPQVTVVKGTDGRPTFDARHCRDMLAAPGGSRHAP
jgi:hypothetical protein